MKITIQIPEIILFGSLAFLFNEKDVLGWSFFGMFVIFSFFRYSMETQRAKERATQQEKLIKNAGEAISGMFVSSFSNRHSSKTIN